MSFINNSFRESLVTKLSNEAEDLLEWNILKKQLSAFSSTGMGKKAILDLQIPKSLDEIKNLLRETIEINNLEKENDHSLDFKGVFDIKKNIKICSKGGIINSIELLEIADTIASTVRLKKILLIMI